jgi:rhodanese-related sulfurtransferase
MANQRRSVEKEAYWRGQLERQSASGQSIRRWCRESGVSEPTFYVWRRELRKRDHERGRTERNRHEPLSEPAFAPGFVAVDVLAPDVLAPDVLAPDVLAPDVLAPDVLTSDVVTPDAVLSGREAKLEIDVAGGVVIRLREDASAETLERVLTVVCRHGIARQGAARGSRGEVESC